MTGTNGHRRKLVKSARKRLASFPELDPSDVVQETLLDLLRSSKSPPPDDDTGQAKLTWHILKCNVVDAVRRATRGRAEKPLAQRRVRAIATDSEGYELADDQTSPSGKVAKAELLERLHAAIAELPPAERDVIRLRVFEERSPGETAQIMGRTERAVAGLLYRAVKRLGRMIAPAAGIEIDS